MLNKKGSALKLKATITKKNKVKLSWAKVNNALRYEIYRSDTISQNDVISNGKTNEYASYKKVKTLKKNKKTWTDKKVKGNMGYSYIVKAVLPKGKTKGDSALEIMEYADASLLFEKVTFVTTKTNAEGDQTVTWNRVYGAKGYKIERYDYNMATKEWDWVPVTTLGKNSTKYTFKSEIYTYFMDEAAQAANDPTVTNNRTYRITPIKSESVLGTSTRVETTYLAGVAKKVSAKVDKAAGGIRITWEKVPNASYYRVYRVMSNVRTNNKDIGDYTSFTNSTAVTEYVGAKAPVKVDVAAYNAEVERSYFDANTTSIVDYYGSEIYEGYSYVTMDYTYVMPDKIRSNVTANDTPTSYKNLYSDYPSWVKESKNTLGADGRVNVAFRTEGKPFTYAQKVIKLGEKGRPQAGVTYDYYVVAYIGTAKAANEYSGGYGYKTNSAAYAGLVSVIDEDNYKWVTNTSGVKKG